jgi:anti-sigma regulatory factor (Ser/Thr protein kinase)
LKARQNISQEAEIAEAARWSGAKPARKEPPLVADAAAHAPRARSSSPSKPTAFGIATRVRDGAGSKREELRLTIHDDLGELRRVNELAREFLESRGIEPRAVYAAELALEEILSNVIGHGYQDGKRHEIAVVLGVREGGVELQVTDDGREFDPLAAPEPKLDVPLAERRIGGLGIHLLRAFARELRYQRLGNLNLLWLLI